MIFATETTTETTITKPPQKPPQELNKTTTEATTKQQNHQANHRLKVTFCMTAMSSKDCTGTEKSQENSDKTDTVLQQYSSRYSVR